MISEEFRAALVKALGSEPGSTIPEVGQDDCRAIIGADSSNADVASVRPMAVVLNATARFMHGYPSVAGHPWRLIDDGDRIGVFVALCGDSPIAITDNKDGSLTVSWPRENAERHEITLTAPDPGVAIIIEMELAEWICELGHVPDEAETRAKFEELNAVWLEAA